MLQLLKRPTRVCLPVLLLLLTACEFGYYEHFPVKFPSPFPLHPPKATSTYDLRATVTARATPSGSYCDMATRAGARTLLTFAEILTCLDTIEKVSEFMAHNMMYDGAWDIRERGGNEYAPAWLVYERGVDDCDGHAIL